MIDYIIIVILSFLPFPAYILGMKHAERKKGQQVPKARNPMPPPPKR